MQFFTPITTRLGISGTKAEKFHTVNHSIRKELELYSPNPPRDSHLPVNHQGHNLSSPMMNVGATSEQDAGSHYQLCRGCGPPGSLRGCDGSRRKIFFITQPLPGHILSLPNISQLFAARRELYTVVKQRARRTTLPSSRSSPSPPSPSDSDSDDGVVVSDGSDPDGGEDTNDIAVPATPVLALQQPLPALRFYNGGYGGVHYSPDGRILPCVAAPVFRTPSPVLGNIHQRDSPQVLRPPSAEVGNRSSSLTLFEDDDDTELYYTPSLELHFPVAVFIWINKLLAPRERDVGDSECIRGKLVLRDYQTALQAAGLPNRCILQRYIDPTGDWIEFDWDNPIELYLSNRILYLRLYVKQDTNSVQHMGLGSSPPRSGTCKVMTL
ncbi:hypothetical protein B0H14DRAFT_2580928 [Mycena olivaceomarginata]|nr:hypothetical protein B0H14DRAFT_2580928 [Mycena olivaceomarginata]